MSPSKWRNMVKRTATIKVDAHYHIRVKYKSGGKTSYFYEVNKPKELVEYIIYQIEELMPRIRFDGHMIYPKRIIEYKIFVTYFLFDKSSETLHMEYPDGYSGDFGGEDVTLRGRSLAESFARAQAESNIDEVHAQVKKIGDIVVRIEEQTSSPTLRERIEDNFWDYIITLFIGFIGAYIAGALFFS